MVRGHPLVPISEPRPQYPPPFEGCGATLADRNLHCFFNVTNCNPSKDRSRLTQILAKPRNRVRTAWDELLMQDDDFFAPGGVTVIKSFKDPPWETVVYFGSSSFASYSEAYTYHKLNLWTAMGRHGKVGVVTNSTDRTTPKSSGNEVLSVNSNPGFINLP